MRMKSVFLFLVFPMLFLLLWWMVFSFGVVPEYIVPNPCGVALKVLERREDFLDAAVSTLTTSILGFFTACAAGLCFGLLIHRSVCARGLILPSLIALKSTPVVALVPIVSLIIGVGFGSKLFFAFTVCFLPMVLCVYEGLKNVPQSLQEFSSSVCSSSFRYFFIINLPAAASYLAIGMKITIPLAFVGAVVAEMTGGDDSGLGYLIISSSYRMDTPLLYASVTILMMLSTLTFYLVSFVIHALVPAARREQHII